MPRTSASAGRRDALLNATAAVIAEHGFEGLRTREVAERAGINHATLHHHFPSKEALVAALVPRLLARLDTLRAIRQRSALSPADELHAHLVAAAAQMLREPELFITLNEFFARARRDASIRELMSGVERAWRGYLLALLRRGREAGEFRDDLDVDAAAEIIVAFLRGCPLPRPPGDATLAGAVRHLEESIWARE